MQVAARLRVFVVFAACVFLTPSAEAQQPSKTTATGVVTDSSGSAIAGARVELLDAAGRILASAATDAEGKFALTADGAAGTLRVRANGFAPAQVPASEHQDLHFQLTPASASEQVVVTANRSETEWLTTAASVAQLSREEVEADPALKVDDLLRRVPGFTLFRRTGSRAANPTAQGLSLRGVGASGASRAAVLRDGVPLNDPFGGWVYWSSVPRAAVGSIEVLRGGASSLYGSDALGGVVSIQPHLSAESYFIFNGSYGNETSPQASATGGLRMGDWVLSGAAEGFRSDGYFLVPDTARGDADARASESHRTGEVTVERRLAAGRWFARGSGFSEDRDNGTELQFNHTFIRQLSSGFDYAHAESGNWSVRLYAGDQALRQSFTTVSDDRNSETLTRLQRVPARQLGMSAVWNRRVHAHSLTAGVEARGIRGFSHELGFFGGNPTSRLKTGGRQNTAGLFVQDIIQLAPRWQFTLGGRFDRWSNHDALSRLVPLAAPDTATTTRFADGSETAFTPRASLLYQIRNNASIYLAGYRAFRAPTLNELYRGFRVGDVVTNANADLRAERLTGGELGTHLVSLPGNVALNAAFFWSEITHPIANVTLSVTPDLITRQRQNLGRTRSRGVELDVESRVTDALTLTAGYAFTNATVLSFSSNPAIEGLDLPQVPRHQLTLQARYARPREFTLSLQGRLVGNQFDDDRNQLPLGNFVVVDAFASRNFGPHAEVFIAAENLFDREYSVGRTPLRTIGAPLLARAGVRFRFSESK